MDKEIFKEKWTIFVVEDDEGLNSLIQKRLSRANFDTCGALSASEACKMIDTNNRILLMLDYKLPDMDGVEFLNKIFSDYGKLPFIVLTGQGDEKTAVEFMKLGARDYLIKEPNLLEYLPEVVQHVIKEIEIELELDKTEHALHKSEESYRMLVSHLTEGILVLNSEGIINYANLMAQNIIDLDSDEIIGKNIRDFIPSNQIKIMGKALENSESSCVKNIEFTIIRASGEKRGIIFSVADSSIENNPFNGFIVSFRDITDRVKAEKKIHYLAKLVEGVSDAIISTNGDFKIASWNKAAENLYGWESVEVIGKPIGDILKTQYPDNGGKVLDGGVCPDDYCEVIQKCKDGREIYALPSVSFLKEDGDETSGMVVVYHDITERKNAERELKISYKKLKNIFDSVVDIIGRIIEVRDPYTAGHERRVSKLAVAIAKKMDLDKDIVDAIEVASAVHDIGKIYVPSEILSKPGKLSKQEFDLIKVHPQMGYEILEAIDFPWPISEIVLQHHERLDGSGYPNTLKGKDILLEAKIIAVADVIEAMSSHRPYRPAPGIEAALYEIQKNRGRLYEPKIVDICVELFQKDSFSL